MNAAPHLRVEQVELYERDVRLRLPFRFGIVTLTEAPQAFVRVRLRTAQGAAWGAAAEVLAPKWFDKDPDLSNEENFDQLRRAIDVARAHYLGAGSDTAFGLFADCYAAQPETAREAGLNRLTASFGPALLDRAVLDALARVHGIGFAEAVQRNLPGVDPARVAPDLAGFDHDGFLSRLRPAPHVHARHTVGLVDALGPDAHAGGPGDGLPETLTEAIARYGHRYFKLKLGGRVGSDLERLEAVARVLDTSCGDYRVTLDGNEQYRSLDALEALWAGVRERRALSSLASAVLLVEQPIARDRALDVDVSRLGEQVPVIIDESDADMDCFPAARARGYRGVSSKSCKGFYKSLVNAMRCARWNEEAPGRYFLSGEDLTCQAGLAVQQDLALVSLLGIDHVERNGHHYVRGMQGAPVAEQQAFLDAHPDVYRRHDGVVGLHVEDGRIALGSLACPGFAAAASPDWASMRRVA